MFLRQLFDPSLAQYAYLIGCQRTGQTIVFDPERDIDRYLELAQDNDLRIAAVAETHIHADFLSGALQLLETEEDATAYLSDEGDDDWKYEWAKGRDDVRLLKDGDSFRIGNILITALHTPGHTPEHLSFLIEDQGGGGTLPMAMITGDFVFVGDVGRPDLLETAAGKVGAREPSARVLYQSIMTFQELPDFVQVLPAHGAGSACGKALGAVPTSTVGYEKRFNASILSALKEGEEPFVKFILEGQPEPPMYFARMKRDNKMGPAVLTGLPDPPRINPADISALIVDPGNVTLDTRKDRFRFMEGHVQGALFTPLIHAFSTVAGSFVTEDQTLYLLLEHESQLETAVRELMRIGLDHIGGYALAADVLEGDSCRECLVKTKSASTAETQSLLDAHPQAVVLDVRSATEYAGGHVPGAINVAYTRLVPRIDELSQDADYLVHCGSGVRAAYACSLLERLGRRVVYLNGPVADVLEATGTTSAEPGYSVTPT